MTQTQLTDSDVRAIERPEPNLLTYYAISSLAAGPAFLIPLIVHYFRYKTLHYRFDEEGLSMSWGILFRREIHLTYARIQDIHLNSNVVERWLGLARIEIQTASGASKAEMTIEGVAAYEALRDYLYGKMRGARGLDRGTSSRAAPAPGSTPPQSSAGEIATALHAVTDELRALRLEIERRSLGKGSFHG